METPYAYSSLLQPRHIRLIQVWFDNDRLKTLEYAIGRAREHGKQSELGNQRDAHAIDEVELQEFQKHFNGPMQTRGRLIEVNLDDPSVSYKAVSYCWGSSDKSHKIWLDEFIYLEITHSAFEVLTWIAVSGTDDLFWIDALCINQGNNEEKSSQVRLMYDVYSKAQEVMAWTGGPLDDDISMLELLEALHREVTPLQDKAIRLTASDIFKFEGCQWPSRGWNALAKFLQRPFFCRVWILQEMVAAKKISLMCGIYAIDWTELAALITSLQSTAIGIYLESVDNS